jgi:hypothetical protein
MAKPIFGRGLAMRCERSEHGKSQLSLKYFCSISCHFFSHLFFYISTTCLYLSVFFRFPMALRLPCIAANDLGLAQWRATCTCHEPLNFLFHNIFQRGTPAIVPNTLIVVSSSMPFRSLSYSGLLSKFLVPSKKTVFYP